MVHSCRPSISWQISSLGRSTLSFPHLTDLLFAEQRPPISSSWKVTFLCRKIHVRLVVASKVIICESRGEVSPVENCAYLTYSNQYLKQTFIVFSPLWYLGNFLVQTLQYFLSARGGKPRASSDCFPCLSVSQSLI